MAQSGRRVIWHCLPLACQKDSRRNSLRSCTPFPRGGPPPAADLFTKSATRRERGDVRRVALECGWVSCEGKPAGAGAPRAEICGLPLVPRARACRPSSEAERGSYDTSIDQESHCGRPHPMCGMPPASPLLDSEDQVHCAECSAWNGWLIGAYFVQLDDIPMGH